MRSPHFRIGGKAITVATVLTLGGGILLGVLANRADAALVEGWPVVGSLLADVVGGEYSAIVVAALPGVIGMLALYRWSVATGIPKLPKPNPEMLAPRGTLDLVRDVQASSASAAKVYAQIGKRLGIFKKTSDRRVKQLEKYRTNPRMMWWTANRVAGDLTSFAEFLQRQHSPLIDEHAQMFSAMDELLAIHATNNGEESHAALGTIGKLRVQGAHTVTTLTAMHAAVGLLVAQRFQQKVNAACIRLQGSLTGLVDIVSDAVAQAGEIEAKYGSAITRQAPGMSGSPNE